MNFCRRTFDFIFRNTKKSSDTWFNINAVVYFVFLGSYLG